MALKRRPRTSATDSTDSPPKDYPMSDLLWLGLLAGLVALTLAYAKLCDEA